MMLFNCFVVEWEIMKIFSVESDVSDRQQWLFLRLRQCGLAHYLNTGVQRATCGRRSEIRRQHTERLVL